MDALKAELALKRKAFDTAKTEDARPTKYVRRGDLERLKEEQERKSKDKKAARTQEEELATAVEGQASLSGGKVCPALYVVTNADRAHWTWRTGCISFRQRNTSS
jgi:pre-mRNA-splicing factor 18